MSKKLQDKKEKSEEFNELLKLTPRILKGEEKERIEPYLSRLKKAIDQEDILNIALTGNYGSGKSTILRTFENEYDEYNYLSISLASFNDDQEKTDIKRNEEIENNDLSNKKKTELQEDIEQQLEISILQQIFYKVSADKIPDSRFKRIKDFDNKRTTIFIALSAVWIICAFILFGFDFIHDLNPRDWDFSKFVSWIAIISLSYFVFGLWYLMKFGFRSFSNSKINKFNVKGEIELGEVSVFNKNLDEILYFFERTDYNVVVFEDIDRFDTTGIFTKLRELNKLINNCELIDRDINFIYAVKDTVFKDKTERVKFFDFIIPVIPFVNSKNASEQLNKLIKQHELTDKLSNKFVSELVSFIHDIDMRLLINTFHEYIVFKDNIVNDDIDHEQLFSIIVYKNLYPEDFSNLYRNEGKLYEVLNKREEHISALVRELELKIPTLENKIEEVERHKHIQISELRSVYILKLLETLPQVNIVNIFAGDRDVRVFELRKDEFFDSLKNSENIQYTREGHRRSSSNIPFRQIENSVDNNHTYNEREELIRGRNNNLSNSIRNEIQEIRNRVSKIRQLSLSEIITEINSEDVYGEFAKNDLVKFLLNEGYISEDYSDYISLFHEQDLTRDEFKFRNKIKRLKEPDFEFKIENHYNFLRNLGERYFSRPQILNYDLIEYLISKNIFISNKKIFYSSLDNRDQKYLDFIIGFIDKKPECRKEFISNLIKNRKSIWDEVFHGKNLPDDEILDFVKHLFENSEAEDIQRLDNVESLNEYIENLESPVSFGASLENIKPLRKYINSQSLKFKNLEVTDKSSQSFFDFIIFNSSYEINYQNIVEILKTKLPDSEDKEIKQAFYSYISKPELIDLKKYVGKNINQFVSKVLLRDESSNSENEDSIITLLNNEDLKPELKVDLVKIQKNKINILANLDNQEGKEIVISANKIKPTWENVFHYYNQLDESSFNETLINFINEEENYSKLSKSNIFDLEEIDKQQLLKFRDDLLYCDKLKADAYRELLSSLTPIGSLDFSLLSSKMAEIILETDILQLNSHNFEGLKTLRGNLHIRLIEKHIQEIIKGDNELSLDNSDWYLILDSKQIKSTQKHQLLKELTVQNFSDSDVAKKVLQIHPEQKINSYGFDEIKTLLSHRVLLKNRISVLLKYIADLNNGQLETIVSQFGEDYADLFGLFKMPSFPNHEPNYLLLKELKRRGIISSVAKEGEKIRARCRRKN
ncbi:MAG: hypothetical protein WD607_08300 [Candidatus Paceibacterota bacterium]